MTAGAVRPLLRASRREAAALFDSLGCLWQDLRAISFSGLRARQSTATALSTCLAVVAALALHLDFVWWAAISGFMSMQSSRPASTRRVLLRIAGTMAGAILALVLTPWVAYDPVAGSLFIFAIAAAGSLGFMVSSHGYAWLFTTITANIVILSSLQDPTQALHYAFYRTAEVVAGSTVALAVAIALAPDGGAAAPAPPGWSHLWDRDWALVMRAIRSGIAVMLLPWISSWLDLPGLSTMAITVTMILAVPVARDDPLETGRREAAQALRRVTGCLIGGLLGLALLALSMTELVPWLLILGAFVWLGTYVQTSTRSGVGYIGTQAVFVLIMTMVQGWTPPTSILPGVDRLAGILGGLAILMAVSLIMLPWGAGRATEPRAVKL